ncbi:filamentous hemagglutinin, partial [Paraburkholderia terricola]
QLALTAQRNVTVASGGTVQAVGDLAIAAVSGSVNSSGTLNGAANLVVSGAQDVALTGATGVTGDTTLTAGHDLTIGGTLAGQGAATLSAGHDVIAGGSSGFVKDTNVTAANDLSVTGTLQGLGVSLTAGQSVALNNVQANNALQVAANGGTLAVNGLVASLSTASLNSGGDTSINGALQSANALSVTSGGNTSIAGSVASNGDVTLRNAAGSLTSTGNIQSGNNLLIDAAQSVDLGTQGTSALADLAVRAGQNLTMNGSVVAQGNGTLTAGGTVAGAAASAFGLAANVSSGGDTNLTGSLRGGTVQTHAGGSASLHDVQAASSLSLAATQDLNITGAVTGGAGVSLNAGQNIGISGSIQSASDTALIARNGSVSSSGTIGSNGAFNVQAGSDINLGGTTTAALDTTLNATRDVNVSGMLAGQGQGSVTASRDIGGAGTMTFTQAATLNAGRDVAQGGLIQGQSVQVTAAGNIGVNNVESASTIALSANGTNTANGPGNLTVNGSVAAAGAVTASARNDVSVAATGKVASGTTIGINAQHDINVAGALESVGDAVLTAQQGSLNATGGINSGGRLNVTTGLDLSLGASTSTVGDATLNAGRDALLNGLLIGEANGFVTAGRDISGAGTQAFAQAASYAAQRDIALTGGLQANVIDATGGNNASLHDVSSATALTLTANGNAGGGDAGITGTASAPGAVMLSAARDVSVSGSLTTGDTLTLDAQRNVSASGTLQTTAGDLTATAATGSIALTGTTTTSGALSLTSALDTQIGGQINAAGSVTVQAGRDITLSGALAGQLDGTLTAAHDINGAGTAAFAQAATLNAAHDLALTGALQGASVSVTGGNNAGLGSVQAVTGNLAVTANGNAGGGDVTLGGTATALGTFALQAARDGRVSGAINTGSATTIDAARNIALADVNSAGDLTIAATSGNASAANVTTQGNLVATAGEALSVSGATTVGGSAQLTSGGDMTLTGGIGAQNAGTLTAGGSMSAASVAFGQQATLNAGGSIGVTGAVATNGALNATAGNDLSIGSAQAGGAIALQAQGHNGAGDVKVNGALASGAAVTVTAARDATIVGNASATSQLTVTAAHNLAANGTVGANGDVTLSATGGNLGVGGAITSQGNLRASSGGALALNGELVNGDTTLNAGGSATLTGAFFGLGLATINAGGSVNGGGSLTFGKDITIGAGGGIVLGAIQGAGLLTATSGGDMSLGATTAVGNVSAKSTSGSVSFGGAVQSGGNVTVQAARNATVAGAVSSMGTVNVSGAQGNVSVAGVSSNGDTTMSAGQTLTLGGTSTVAGQFTLSGGNVTLSGSQGGSKNVSVSAQGTLDASQASMVSTQNMQFSGTNVTLGTVIAGGALTATASNQLSLVGAAVDAVGAATLTSGNVFYNASQVLSGGTLYVSAPDVTNAANASLASTTTTTVNATNFTNAGLVNGATTNVTVAGGLNNSGGSLMAVNSLVINTGTLNNQNGIIFAGNPNTPNGPTTGDVSLTINGGDGSFYNGGGQLLAQRNMGVSAVNMAFDPSQGTISQGGQLSITAASISNTGTWNYGGQGVTLTGIYGINNYGTMTGTVPLTLSTNGTLTNFGQVTGSDVTFNGTLNNVAGAVMHADGTLALNGNTTNRGTVEASGLLSVTGGDYDNQGATTQSKGDANFNLAGTLLNTGGSIFAGNNISITAGAVVNDQTAPGAPVTTTTTASDPSLLLSGKIGTETVYMMMGSSDHQHLQMTTSNATVADLLTAAQAAGSSITLDQMSDGYWYVDGPSSEASIDGGNTLVSQMTVALPTVNRTSTSETPGTSGVISAGNSIQLTAGSLSNQGGQIAAAGSISLSLGTLANGSVAPTVQTSAIDSIDQNQYNAFLASLSQIEVAKPGAAVGVNMGGGGPTTFAISAQAAPLATSTAMWSSPTGMIAAGYNLIVSSGGSLTNAGLMYAGNNVIVAAGSLTNQGGNQQSYSTQTGCAAGVPSTACGTAGNPRGSNPTTTTFGYSQNDATIYAGNDLVIAAGQINNTFGNLLAGHDIVIGGVGTTASSTTPAGSLNNTSGNIVAGNNITLNVSGAITNNLPPPVPVHENYGMNEQYSGCMTAGGYKESYCEGYVDQQSGSSSVISAGNNLQINAGSLTNIGSLIAAGNTATIAVAGPVVNEAQTLNAYWHSHWVQQTGDFSADRRHDVWACGSVAECTALYGSAYTSAGGTIDPPQPVGNIAATIQAPNLSITAGGQIQNVGNVIGTSVTLTGQKLINGITTANTYTPRVNAPSQVISLSPVSLPGLNLSVPRAVGGALPTPVAGKASYVDNSLGTSALSNLGPQDLLNALPTSLQPGSTLFYYNPQEEDLMLQQAALQQTGKASFIDGLTYDSTRAMSVTEQEKQYLYQNALDYATANNLQLGTALTQTQINALDKPMLWYVEQTVPDPSCAATGTATCPAITALMPQVYLPSDTSAMSAGGNITGTDVTLNFNKDSGGSILNTGSITASNTLTVNTGTLTNQANQVNVGEIWQYVKDAGYSKTTGTEVQPGGFMSAANMDLNVQTLSQIGGALQKLNADGSLDSAGTQQLLATLQQQLGAAFVQTSVSDNLHQDFVKEGGSFGVTQIGAIVVAVVAAILMQPEISAAIASMSGAADAAATAAFAAAQEGLTGAAITAAASAAGGTLAVGGLANTMIAVGLSSFASSALSQVITTGSINIGAALRNGLIGAATAGLTNGITFDTGSGSVGFNVNASVEGVTAPSLASLAGIQNVGNTLVPQAGTAAGSLPTEIAAIASSATIQAGLQTVIGGGSFLDSLKNSLVNDAAAAGAFAIGNAFNAQQGFWTTSNPLYAFEHAALGCAAGAAGGTGCAEGAIGGAISAGLNPIIDANGNIPPAALTAIETLVSGSVAGALGFNVQGAVTAAQNETLNNWLNHVPPSTMLLSEQQRYDNAVAACNNGDSQACDTNTALQTLSQQRDAALASACAGGSTSPTCKAAVTAALAGGNTVQLINGTAYAFDPNAPAIKAVGNPYQIAYANSFDGQLAQSTADALQFAPIEIPGVAAGVGAISSVVRSLIGDSVIIDAGIQWGKGIMGQGMPWENYLATQMPSGSRLPSNFKTFDFYDPVSGVATSAKTLDTTTAARLADPTQVYSSLKSNIDATINFSGYQLSGVSLTPDMIASRNLQVAVSASTTPAQWQQINNAVQYGASKGVNVKITVTR